MNHKIEFSLTNPYGDGWSQNLEDQTAVMLGFDDTEFAQVLRAYCYKNYELSDAELNVLNPIIKKCAEKCAQTNGTKNELLNNASKLYNMAQLGGDDCADLMLVINTIDGEKLEVDDPFDADAESDYLKMKYPNVIA